MINDIEQSRLSESELYNVALSKRFFREVWNERRPEILPEIFSPDVVFHHEHEKIIGLKRWKAEFYDVLIRAAQMLVLSSKTSSRMGILFSLVGLHEVFIRASYLVCPHQMKD